MGNLRAYPRLQTADRSRPSSPHRSRDMLAVDVRADREPRCGHPSTRWRRQTPWTTRQFGLLVVVVPGQPFIQSAVPRVRGAAYTSELPARVEPADYHAAGAVDTITELVWGARACGYGYTVCRHRIEPDAR